MKGTQSYPWHLFILTFKASLLIVCSSHSMWYYWWLDLKISHHCKQITELQFKRCAEDRSHQAYRCYWPVLSGGACVLLAFSVLFYGLTGGTSVLLCLFPGDGGGEIPFSVWILSLEQCLWDDAIWRQTFLSTSHPGLWEDWQLHQIWSSSAAGSVLPQIPAHGQLEFTVITVMITLDNQ